MRNSPARLVRRLLAEPLRPALALLSCTVALAGCGPRAGGTTQSAPEIAAAREADARGPADATLSSADSNLIYAILSAEERRDATAEALQRGPTHPDARIQRMSRRAFARINDSTFAARDSLGLPDGRDIPSWRLPEWSERFRVLTPRTVACDTLFRAVSDSAIQVRLRALALAGSQSSCRTHGPMLAALRGFIAAVPERADARRIGRGSWHEGAAALASYAMLEPDSVRSASERFARHAMPQVRRAAARAATSARDTALLRQLARDIDGNVTEAAIEGLSRIAGRAADSLYLARLGWSIPQVALAAATALKGSTHPGLRPAVQRALAQYQTRNAASERDVRTALRALLGDSTPEPWALRQPEPLPREVIGLALGERRYVQVISSRLHGGRSFTIELRGDLAPIMAARVLARVRNGDYNGQRWHRVEPGFVIQGGSQWDNEYSGSSFFLVDELARLPHPRGSVGMSTRGHDTGDAQWFINLRDNARLMRDYTVFGVVVEGMSVVDDVLEGDEFYVMREVSAPRRPARP